MRESCRVLTCKRRGIASLLSQSLSALAFTTLLFEMSRLSECFFLPFGLGKNVLVVLVQVHLRMVQLPEPNGSIFSGGRLVRIHIVCSL
jgi:hypothetical protein